MCLTGYVYRDVNNRFIFPPRFKIGKDEIRYTQSKAWTSISAFSAFPEWMSFSYGQPSGGDSTPSLWNISPQVLPISPLRLFSMNMTILSIGHLKRMSQQNYFLKISLMCYPFNKRYWGVRRLFVQEYRGRVSIPLMRFKIFPDGRNMCDASCIQVKHLSWSMELGRKSPVMVIKWGSFERTVINSISFSRLVFKYYSNGADKQVLLGESTK